MNSATTSAATLTVTPVSTPTSGSLVGSSSTAATSYNLTTLGTSDWAHFGTNGSASGFDHKAASNSGGGSQISNVTKVGTGGFGGYKDDTGNRNASWTDGTPDTKATADTGFLYANNGIGAGYSFTAPAIQPLARSTSTSAASPAAPHSPPPLRRFRGRRLDYFLGQQQIQ